MLACKTASITLSSFLIVVMITNCVCRREVTRPNLWRILAHAGSGNMDVPPPPLVFFLKFFRLRALERQKILG